MTTRRMMIAVAALALVLAGVVGMNQLDRRADLFRKEADYHRQWQERLATEATYLESLAGNPSGDAELPSALHRTRRWSRGQALEMELEAAFGAPSSPRFQQLSSRARRDAILGARAYRKASEHHARERNRYERAALSPWLTVEPDPPASAP